MLGRILMRKYFEIETDVKYKTHNDTNYSNNDNKIFENNNSELNEQISPINKLDFQLNNKLLNEIDYKNKINKLV